MLRTKQKEAITQFVPGIDHLAIARSISKLNQLVYAKRDAALERHGKILDRILVVAASAALLFFVSNIIQYHYYVDNGHFITWEVLQEWFPIFNKESK